MNIELMLNAQRELDERIMSEHQVDGKETFKNLMVALQVELAEMANESRFFKYWSEDQSPRTALYTFTGNHGWEYQAYADPREDAEVAEFFGFDPAYAIKKENPLLEEYVDALHFFLSIAIRKGWEQALDVRVGQMNVAPGDLNLLYLDLVYFLNASYREEDNPTTDYKGMSKNEVLFHYAWLNFVVMGLQHFNFSVSEIEAAYYEKNEKNHARQEAGY